MGDVAVFERTFNAADFMVFSRLSGDFNRLHHDEVYARSSGFGGSVVPLHLLLAPLSCVAGMIFPGEPSLYLGHEARAAKPVYYGESLRYSARIQSVNAAHRVLTIRTIALRGTDVVLDALLRVQATTESWSSSSKFPILRTAAPGRALVTGASGAIGGAIALSLASRGWALLLQDRGDGPERQTSRATLDRFNAEAEFIAADLSTVSGCASLTAAASVRSDIELVVHAASPGLTAPLEELVAVNFSALKKLAAALLPGMLARQKGKLLLVGSTAMLRILPGWDDYVAAKAMAVAFVTGLNSQFSHYGVQGLVVMPGYVATRFSEAVRGNAPAMLPQEVAATVIDMVDAPESSVVVLENGRRTWGHFGFSSTPQTAAVSHEATTVTHPSSGSPSVITASSSATVADIVRRILRLPQGADLVGAGIGITPGWDSLAQIEVILAIEAELGFRFTSAELIELGSFDALAVACQRKVAPS